MKKILTLLFSLVLLTTIACSDKEHPITMSQLPAAAQELIAEHFEGMQISYIMEDRELGSREYDVWFANGNKIEFDKDGEWRNIECRHMGVPVAIVPVEIMNHVNGSYAKVTISGIERDRRGYEVRLSNGMELTFDRNYNLTEVGD